mgnify:CR=1 FL=1
MLTLSIIGIRDTNLLEVKFNSSKASMVHNGGGMAVNLFLARFKCVKLYHPFSSSTATVSGREDSALFFNTNYIERDRVGYFLKKKKVFKL